MNISDNKRIIIFKIANLNELFIKDLTVIIKTNINRMIGKILSPQIARINDKMPIIIPIIFVFSGGDMVEIKCELNHEVELTQCIKNNPESVEEGLKIIDTFV